MMHPFDIVEEFEEALCEYTGAKYAVTCHRCISALVMCCEYLRVGEVQIPRYTYVEVPMAVLRGGGSVRISDFKWHGAYSLHPSRIVDSARRFHRGMYPQGFFQCVSFHRSKILGFTEGGAILCNDKDAAEWFRKARFGGRTAGAIPHVDPITMIGWDYYMQPGIAAELLARLAVLPNENADLPNGDYPDLAKVDWNGLWKSQRARPLKTTHDLQSRLQRVRQLRAKNNDTWMDLLEHVADLDPEYFVAWQDKVREADESISKAMR